VGHHSSIKGERETVKSAAKTKEFVGGYLSSINDEDGGERP